MNLYNKIILYDDKNLMYLTGEIYNEEIHPQFIDFTSITDTERKRVYVNSKIIGEIYAKESETIKLDETLMKRIAKYNKEAEIKEYDKIIEEKKKKIEELDNILQDKEKRVEKIKQFIANIYDIDIYDDDDDYDYEEE